jgi:NADP-dependent 3-hydroxy acid dehydrogenase YdfG
MIERMSRLAGKVIAITGASAGIGRATAELVAAEGAAVALLARRADRLAEVVAGITARGGRAVAMPGDVTVEGDSRRLVSRAAEAFGRLDVMICNAGIGYHGTLDDTPPDVMRRIVDVNLMGTLYAARAALELFRRQQHGHIIAVSSIVGRRGIGGSSVYSATKAAQVGLIEGLRAEFVGTNLKASIVYPVAVDTEFREALRRDYGRLVEGHGPRQTSADVAKMILDCILTGKAEAYPFRKAFWFAVLSVVAPARTDRLVRRFGRRVTAPDRTNDDTPA